MQHMFGEKSFFQNFKYDLFLHIFMKKLILPFLIISLLFLTACCQKDTVNYSFDPSDTSIYYETGAMYVEWGQYKLNIDKGGEATFEAHAELELKKAESFQVSEEELDVILNIAEENDFLGLNDNYEDPSIMDGGYSLITINYGDEYKSVRVANINIPEFDAVETAITQLLENKIDDPFSY